MKTTSEVLLDLTIDSITGAEVLRATTPHGTYTFSVKDVEVSRQDGTATLRLEPVA